MDTSVFISLFSNVWALFLVILFFGGSIFIHELGHFLAARHYGLKVERFSIGFGPKLIAWKRNGVEYRISLFPFGGYVALPELSDMGRLEGGSGQGKALRPSIPYGTKVVVLAMGAIFNIIFAFVLSVVLWGVGQPSSEPAQTTTLGYVPEELIVKEGVTAPGPAFLAGLKPGDKIISVDDYTVENFTQIQQYLMTGTGRSKDGRPMAEVRVERNRSTQTFTVYPELVEINPSSGDKVRMAGIGPSYRLVVGSVAPNSPAQKAGVLPGDQVISVEGSTVYHVMDINKHLEGGAGDPVGLTLKRSFSLIPMTLVPEPVAVTKASLSVYMKNDKGQEGVFRLVSDVTVGEATDSKQFIVYEIDAIAEELSGLSLGDKLVSVYSGTIFSIEALQTALMNSAPLAIQLENGSQRTFSLKNVEQVEITPPQERSMLGITFVPPKVLIYLNPLTQFVNQLKSIYQILRSIISPQSDVHINHLSSLPGVFRVLHQFSLIDLRLVLVFVLFINLNFAILNLLPIPVLDGGHILFETIAKLRGKSFSPRFIIRLQSSFMFLLFGLMLYVSFFDLRRWHGDHHVEKQMEYKQLILKEPKFNNVKSQYK